MLMSVDPLVVPPTDAEIRYSLIELDLEPLPPYGYVRDETLRDTPSPWFIQIDRRHGIFTMCLGCMRHEDDECLCQSHRGVVFAPPKAHVAVVKLLHKDHLPKK